MKHKFQLLYHNRALFLKANQMHIWSQWLPKEKYLNLNNFTLDCECLIMIGYSMYSNQQLPYKEVCITL